jgi:hypothetical protein
VTVQRLGDAIPSDLLERVRSKPGTDNPVRYPCRCAEGYGWLVEREGGKDTVRPCDACNRVQFDRWAEGGYESRGF